MLTFLAIAHVIIGLGLVVFVLLQDPKDGAAGIFGGGSSSKSFLGATGATSFLHKATVWTAILFACTSLILTSLATKRSTSVLDQPDGAIPTAPSTPAAPGTNAAPAGANSAPAAPNSGTPAPANPATPGK